MKKDLLETFLEFATGKLGEAVELETVGQLTPEELETVKAATDRMDAEKERIENLITEEADRLRAEMKAKLKAFVDEVEKVERVEFEETARRTEAVLREIIGRYTENHEGIHIHKETGELKRRSGRADG